jgi:CDP-glucose 4,6-dehydratase
LGQYLLEEKSFFADSWNLAPSLEDTISVQEVLDKVLIYFSDLKIEYSDSIFAEAQMLKLDCSKAKQQMLWNSIWDINKSIELSILWYKEYLDSKKILTKEQLEQYFQDAQEKHATWIIKN